MSRSGLHQLSESPGSPHGVEGGMQHQHGAQMSPTLMLWSDVPAVNSDWQGAIYVRGRVSSVGHVTDFPEQWDCP